MARYSLFVAAQPGVVVGQLWQIVRELGWTPVPPQPGVQVEAHRGANFLSWGDRVQAVVLQHDQGTQLVLRSRPKAQLYNWGQDAKNLRSVLHLLSRRLPCTAPTEL